MAPVGAARAGVMSGTRGVELPDSAVHQYDATQLSGFADGDPVNTWADLIGDADLTGGSPEYKENIQNGLPIVRWDDETSGLHSNITDVGPPNTVAVVVAENAESSNNAYFSNNTAPRLDINDDNGGMKHRVLWGGDNAELVTSGSTGDFFLVFCIFRDNGDAVTLRANGNETSESNSGTVSDKTWEEIVLGSMDTESEEDVVDIGEAIMYDTDLSSNETLSEEEQRLADKWGISLD